MNFVLKHLFFPLLSQIMVLVCRYEADSYSEGLEIPYF